MIFISLNPGILLILVNVVDVIDDLYMYVDMPPEKEKFELCVRKSEKDDGEGWT